jgi:hypothetical protein
LLLTTLLNELGRQLVREFQWSQLVTAYTFSTVASTQTYAPPTDMLKLVDQSEWNRSTKFPMGGPLSPQSWEYLQALVTAASFTTLFKLQGGQIYLYPTPSGVQTMAFQYVSSWWVAPTATPTVRTSDKTTVASDVLFFDPQVLNLGLQWKFRRRKNMDFATQEEDYRAALEAAKNEDPAPVLSLNGGRPFIPLLDGRNIPPTGFGT